MRPTLLLSLVALALFTAILLAVMTTLPSIVELDGWLSAAAHRFAVQQPRWQAVMRAVTHLGDTWFVLGAELVVAVHLAWRKAWAALLSAAAAITMIFLVSSGVRALVSRARPLDHLVSVAGFSFPSAHATSTASAALILVMIYLPRVARRHRARSALALAGWPIVVGVSRVALVAHWPSDVLGGWLLALGLVPVTYLLAGRLTPPPDTAGGSRVGRSG